MNTPIKDDFIKEMNVKFFGPPILTFGLILGMISVAGCGKPQNRRASESMTEQEIQDEFEAVNAAAEAAANDTAIPPNR